MSYEEKTEQHPEESSPHAAEEDDVEVLKAKIAELKNSLNFFKSAAQRYSDGLKAEIAELQNKYREIDARRIEKALRRGRIEAYEIMEKIARELSTEYAPTESMEINIARRQSFEHLANRASYKAAAQREIIDRGAKDDG